MTPVTIKSFLKPEQVQPILARSQSIKISIRQEGWYRITQAELAAVGLSEVDPRNLQLYLNGKQVAILVTGQADGRFDVQDALEFYGTGLDTPSTDTQAYWLVAGTNADYGSRRWTAARGRTNPELLLPDRGAPAAAVRARRAEKRPRRQILRAARRRYAPGDPPIRHS